jgi:hypothetical protein
VSTETAAVALARRYRADEWTGINRLPGALHVRHWYLDDRAVPSMERRVERRLPLGLGTTSGIWAVGDSPDRIVKVDVLECPSRTDAHQALPTVLGQVESPVLARDVDLSIGDVAFTLPGTRLVVFARANLIVVVASIGTAPGDAAAPAAAIDAAILRAGGEASPTTATTFATAATAAPVALRVQPDADDPSVRRIDVRLPRPATSRTMPMVRVFAPPGDLYEVADGLRYRPADPGTSGWLAVRVEERYTVSGASRTFAVRERVR